MVRRVISLMYQEVRGLHQAAYVLGLFAVASQVLALLRDRLLAHQFGAGSELDIYYAAFRIPDLLFVLFASTLSVYVLIPFVSGRKKNEGSQLLSQVFTLFLLVYALVAAAAFVWAPMLMPRLFPGIGESDQLVTLSRLLLLQPFFLGLSSLFGVVTQLGHRFVVYAISPLVYNLGIIAGIVVFYPVFGILGLGIGVVIGAVLHLLVQLPFVLKDELSIRFTWRFRWRDIASVLALSLPRALTLSMQQIVLLALVGLASAMTVGSVSIFQFAYNLQSVPLAIIGVSYSVAAFPMLAELWREKKSVEFSFHVTTALRHIIFWAVPAIALIIVLRAQIVRVVLGSGAFDWGDTRLTAAVLGLLVVSLLAQAVSLVVVRAFYAGGKTFMPFLITFFCSALAVAGAYGFLLIYAGNSDIQYLIINFMRLEGVVGAEVLAIAFGFALAAIVQAFAMLVALGVCLGVRLRPLLTTFFQAFMAAVIGGCFAYVALNFLVEGVEQARFVGILIQGFIGGCVGIFGVAITYSWFGSVELGEVFQSFQKKLLKTDVVAPQEEVI